MEMIFCMRVFDDQWYFPLIHAFFGTIVSNNVYTDLTESNRLTDVRLVDVQLEDVKSSRNA